MAPVVQAVPVEHRGSAGLVDIQEIQEPVELRVRPVCQEQVVQAARLGPVVRQENQDIVDLVVTAARVGLQEQAVLLGHRDFQATQAQVA